MGIVEGVLLTGMGVLLVVVLLVWTAGAFGLRVVPKIDKFLESFSMA